MSFFEHHSAKIQELTDEVIALEMALRNLDSKKRVIKSKLQRTLTELLSIRKAQEEIKILPSFLNGDFNEG